MANTSFNWKLIGLLSLVAVFMASLSILGFTQGIELFLWLGFSLIAAWLLSRKVSSKLFLHGLILGLTWGLINGLSQSAFFDTYISNNPIAQTQFEDVTIVHPRIFFILFSPVYGVFIGAVIGGLALLMKRVVKS